MAGAEPGTQETQEKPAVPTPGSQTPPLPDRERTRVCVEAPPSVVLSDDSLSYRIEKPSTLETVRAKFSFTGAKSNQIKCCLAVSWKMSHKRMMVF